MSLDTNAATTYTETVNGIKWTYTISSGKAVLWGGSSSTPAIPVATSGAITIPSILGGYQVTGIWSYAFYCCSDLTSVTIPDGVTSIGSCAFCGCSSLTSVTVADSVTSIGNSAFSGCSSLTSVTIPDGVTSIESYAFSNCSGLTNVTIPDSVISIGNSAFYGCSGLRDVVAPQVVCSSGLRSIFPSVYQSITNVTFSAAVTSIGNSAFSDCSSLTSVMIPDGVTSIGSYAFRNCSRLASVSIPGSVRSIGVSAFDGTPFYEGMPDGFVILGCVLYAMKGTCPSIVTIPDGVTSVGPAAFKGCSSLTSLMIPGSVESIGNQAFDGCSKLKNVHVEDVAAWCNIKFGNYYSNPLVYANKFYVDDVPVSELVIPDSVTCIGDFAFCKCSALISVTIPASVTRIGAYAFRNCSGLTQMNIPDTVTSVGDYAFYSCTKLKFVELGNSIISIGENAFENCSRLASVTIPDSVTSIGRSAFDSCSGLTNVAIGCAVTSIGDSAFRSCRGLTSITIPDSVTSIGTSAFSGCSGLRDIVVPQVVCSSELRDIFPFVCQTITNVTISTAVTNIGHSAFSDCSGLMSVKIPDSVTSIGDSAFYGCSGLRSVTIPDSVTSIGDSAFRSCRGLTSITIPDSVTSIGSYAFYGCSGLTSISVAEENDNYMSRNGMLLTKDGTTLIQGINGDVVIPNGVTSIGHGSFGDCRGLTGVVIPDSVSSIGDAAFDGCSGLTNVTIPGGVTGIGEYAFRDCSGLTNIVVAEENENYMSRNGMLLTKGGTTLIQGINGDVVIPNGVTSVRKSAFEGCSGLISVMIPDDVTSIEEYVFRDCSSLTSIVVAEGNENYMSRNGMLLTKDGTSLIQGINGDVVIPNDVTSIEEWAFYNCSGLTSVAIGNGVTNIGNSAFYGCSGLRDVVAPQVVCSSGLRSIFPSVYQSITNVTISTAVTNIGHSAFSYCGGLMSVKMPDSVTSIGASVFYNCSSLTSVIFDGDAPTVGSSAFSGVATTCRVYVRRASSGWGVEIPGTWQGVSIDYVQRNVTFDANGGDCAVASVSIVDGSEIGQLPTPTQWGYTFKGWWTSQDDGEKVTEETIIEEDQTLYARWERHSVAKPVTVPADGSVFYGDSCEVMITCATDGAVVYYSTNGVLPEIDEGHLYAAPFVIADTTVIKAVAVFEGVQSDCVTVAITKEVTTLNVVLDAPDSVTIASDSSVPWQPVVDDTAKVGGSSARSGAIGNRAETWLSATVEGAGTMSFWCKTSCEHDEDNMFTWDRLMIYTNDVEIVEWRMDGETDWTERTLSFEGGVNTVKWVYYKDRTGADGEDCAWVDAVTWTPSEAADPIPAVAVDADAATVNAAVDGAGFVDAAVKVAIGGSAAEYNAFKTWAAGVKGATGDALAGEAAVVANAHAAAAYLLGSERLF